MAIEYTYKCSFCEEEFTKLLPIDERDLPLSEPCPNCGTEEIVSRVIGTTVKAIWNCSLPTNS